MLVRIEFLGHLVLVLYLASTQIPCARSAPFRLALTRFASLKLALAKSTLPRVTAFLHRIPILSVLRVTAPFRLMCNAFHAARQGSDVFSKLVGELHLPFMSCGSDKRAIRARPEMPSKVVSERRRLQRNRQTLELFSLARCVLCPPSELIGFRKSNLER
jgi:hypothetical protein